MGWTPLDRYIRAHNRGVRSGDFRDLGVLFTRDASMVFLNLPVGPFHGRDAILRAFANEPPNDELVVVDSRVSEDGDELIAHYRWRKAPDDPGGTLRVRVAGERIQQLTVHATFKTQQP